MSDYKAPTTTHNMIFLHDADAEVSGLTKLAVGDYESYPVVELVLDTLQLTIFPKGRSIVELGEALSKAGDELTAIAEEMAALSLTD